MLLGEDPRVNLAEPASALYLTRMILIAVHVRSSKVQMKTLKQVASAAEGRCGAKSNSCLSRKILLFRMTSFITNFNLQRITIYTLSHTIYPVSSRISPQLISRYELSMAR
jgi:hypothetical protein